MRTAIVFAFSLFAAGATVNAAELQGVVVDWKCIKPMVRDGREKVLKDRRSCSLMNHWDRSAYGLITIDKKFYRLNDPGNGKIKQLLNNTPDKDNLKVVVTGDISGGAINVINISML